MSNSCSFRLKAIGTEKDLKKFVKEIRHICRLEDPRTTRCGDTSVLDVCGDCRWSVYSSMMNHLDDHALPAASSIGDGIEVAVVGHEPGVGHSEFLHLKNGEELEYDACDYSFAWLDDCKSYAAFVVKYGMVLSKADFESAVARASEAQANYIDIGGYDENVLDRVIHG